MKHPIFYPEQAYPILYPDVMKHHVFSDSKTFADAVAVAPPEEINAAYSKIQPKNKESILAFVSEWFRLNKENSATYQIQSNNVTDHIEKLWPYLTRPSDTYEPYSSKIPLSHSYVVPGGRFNEIYYWDSYFTMLGLRISGHLQIIRDMIHNFSDQLEQFGHIPNGNRSYFLSRSQPPFFSLMVNLLADIDGDDVYTKFLPALLQEHAFWTNVSDKNDTAHRRMVLLHNGYFLNRYFDDSDTPRTESYAEDVEMGSFQKEEAGILYRHLKAACESGWDFSSRWLSNPDHLLSIHTLDFIPVDLNVLLYISERTIARCFALTDQEPSAITFENHANQRAHLIQSLLWDEENGIFNDYLFAEGKQGTPSLACMFPLYAGIATGEQAERTIEYAKSHFLKPGGWGTSNVYSHQQWDAPNGWAPLQWIVFEALKKYGAIELAKDGAQRWLELNENVFQRTGRMMEKYNVEDLSLDAGGGEYPVQDGFGWTNGVYLALKNNIRI